MKLERRQLIWLLFFLLSLCFVATTITNYWVSKESIRQSILDTELPLTADNIYSEIQKDLLRPIFVSSTMATDTFLRDWVIAGEKDPSKVTRYLSEISTRYGAHTSFFVSDRSHLYYTASGLLKQVEEKEARDAWYFRVRNMAQPYEINLDPDLAHQDKLTIFVNYRVFDYLGQFIGATGIGLRVDAVRALINDYEKRYRRTIYFVDQSGKVALFANQSQVAGTDIRNTEGLNSLATEILAGKEGAYEYKSKGMTQLLNVRYIPELHWYLFVEKQEEEALSQIRHTLVINLLISALVTLLVLVLVYIAVGRYQTRLETMAMTDKLTGLANRQAFDLLIGREMAEYQRSHTEMAAIMLDLDHFKNVNDRYGHFAGDAVLRGVADLLRTQLRTADLVCRWGGEEFLVILKTATREDVLQVAEKLRLSVESASIPLEGKTLRATISLGVALMGLEDTQETLVNRADRALYQAKQDGRNVVREDIV